MLFALFLVLTCVEWVIIVLLFRISIILTYSQYFFSVVLDL